MDLNDSDSVGREKEKEKKERARQGRTEEYKEKRGGENKRKES